MFDSYHFTKNGERILAFTQNSPRWLEINLKKWLSLCKLCLSVKSLKSRRNVEKVGVQQSTHLGKPKQSKSKNRGHNLIRFFLDLMQVHVHTRVNQ